LKFFRRFDLSPLDHFKPQRSNTELDETIETTVADTADNAEVALEKKNQGEVLRGAMTKLSAPRDYRPRLLSREVGRRGRTGNGQLWK
jgi:hypothetical protein